nr:RidA family protein [uncultured Albidiferax sp.]
MSTNSVLPFSKIRQAGALVFLSGELPLTSSGTVPDGISAQTELVLKRIQDTLGLVGLDLTDVVQVTVFLTHVDDFAAFNAIYRTYFPEPYPTRTTVLAQLVVPFARIEVTVVAASRKQ